MGTWLEKSRGYVVLSSVFCIILAAVILVRQPAPVSIQIIDPTPRPTRTPAQIVVHVTGAVVRPDVYALSENARLVDAVQAAGGLRPDADQAALNLAAPLRDGTRVHVPAVGTAPEPPPQATGAGVAGEPAVEAVRELPQTGGPIDLNTASTTELESLPGIGPVLAQRIVDDREANGPYTSVDDLLRVSGIGPAILEKLRPYATVH